MSSSSDEENLELLKEAADSTLINDDMFSGKQTTKLKIEEKLPSLRPQRQIEQFNQLHVTPEFQHHVAKKLSSLLDQQLEECLSNKVSKIKKKKCKHKGGIKLFTNSREVIKKIEETPEVITQSKPIKKSIEKDLTGIAINPEDILSKKETLHWSNRSKAPVYRYKQKKGKLIALE